MASIVERVLGFARMVVTLESLPPPADSGSAAPAAPRARKARLLFRIEALPEDPPAAPDAAPPRRSLWAMLFAVEKLDLAPPLPSAPRRPYLRWLLSPEKLD